jgi:hypothetical protein
MTFLTPDDILAVNRPIPINLTGSSWTSALCPIFTSAHGNPFIDHRVMRNLIIDGGSIKHLISVQATSAVPGSGGTLDPEELDS